MRIKRFTGSTVRDAIKDVKAEFGANALILSTKRLGTGLYEVVAAVDYDFSQPVTLDLGGAGGRDERPSPAAEAKAPDALDYELRKELRELKELKKVCMAMVSNSGGPFSDIFSRLEGNLVEYGIDRRLAKKILMNTISGVTGEKAADIVYLRGCIKKKLYERISVSDPLSGRGVVAFVGPTGVGKTTTVAKLAALNALKKKRRLALITMDTRRIAAPEQLRVYGRLIGVPVEVARDAHELDSFIKAHGDKDLILVDTAGGDRSDRERMNELKALAAARPGMKFNLVLNSQTRDEVLYGAVKGFGALPLDSLTFTRLDEGTTHGPILNAMVLARKPVAYLSTGSRVPQDIEAASRDSLMKFIMPN